MIDSTRLTDPYIYVRDNTLSEDRCKAIIKKFDADEKNHHQGKTALGINIDYKNSKDLPISSHDHWKEEDKLFFDLIKEGHENYYNHLNEISNFIGFNNPSYRYRYGPLDGLKNDLLDTGYQIQRTDPGKGYVWHDDYAEYNGQIRYLTFILYLNTVEEGWTQFYNGDQVSPRTGRLVFFPATWTYVHQGYPPKQTKYLMTGWMHTEVKSTNEDGKN